MAFLDDQLLLAPLAPTTCSNKASAPPAPLASQMSCSFFILADPHSLVFLSLCSSFPRAETWLFCFLLFIEQLEQSLFGIKSGWRRLCSDSILVTCSTALSLWGRFHPEGRYFLFFSLSIANRSIIGKEGLCLGLWTQSVQSLVPCLGYLDKTWWQDPIAKELHGGQQAEERGRGWSLETENMDRGRIYCTVYPRDRRPVTYFLQ